MLCKRPILFVLLQSLKNIDSCVLKVVVHFPSFVRFLTEDSFSKFGRSVKNDSFFKKICWKNHLFSKKLSCF